MKNFGFILIMFFSSILSVNATTYASSSIEGSKVELQKELIQLVGDLNVQNFELDQGETFTVEFIVNDSGEIVVLKTSSETFDKAIKARFNYHAVKANVEKNHKYILPISIKK